MADDQVFVVMQIGAKDSSERKRADEIFNYIVKPALGKFGLRPYRADLDPAPGAITPKILSELIESRAVIADLTGRNANVYYELGIAHSFARPLISIADTVDSLPFDAKDERVIALGSYADSGLTYAQGEEAKASLIASLEIVLAEGYVAPSPLREVAGTQSLDDLAPENPVVAEMQQMRETLAEIRARVMPRVRVPAHLREDLSALRGFIEISVARGVFEADDLRSLILVDTSPQHDDWVRDLVDKIPDPEDPWAEASATGQAGVEAPAAPQENQAGTPLPNSQTAADDPWANAPSPWATAADEPPF